MSEPFEAVLKLFVGALALALVVALLRGRSSLVVRHRQRILLALAVLGALSYVNFGRFHTDGTLLHVWDQYHYVIGSKYFAELGYDGIYVATLEARREGTDGFEMPQRIRDLRTNRVVATTSLDEHFREVRSRFSEDRWKAFRSDVTGVWLGPALFLDHGFNPTPAHVAVSQVFSRLLPFRYWAMKLLALLDFLLLGASLYAVSRAFGREALAGALLVLGLGYCSRFYWVGGAFLRQDWLAATLLCASALKRGRPALAGVALAYAASVRVFPVLFLVPLAVHVVGSRLRGQRSVGVARFVVGFAVAALCLVGAGTLAGRGAHAWTESAQRLTLHGSTVGPNAVGLRFPFMASLPNLRGDLVDPTTLYEYSRVAADFARHASERAGMIAVTVLLFLALALRAAWTSREPWEAFVIGVPVVFAVSTLSCYYGAMFVLLPLVRPLRTTAWLLGATLLTYLTVMGVFLLSQAGVIRLNGAAAFVPVSVLLAGTLVAWLLQGSRSPEPALLRTAHAPTAPADSM